VLLHCRRLLILSGSAYRLQVALILQPVSLPSCPDDSISPVAGEGGGICWKEKAIGLNDAL